MGQTSKTSAYIPPPVCVVHIVDDDDDDCDDDDGQLRKNLPKDFRKEFLVGRMTVRCDHLESLKWVAPAGTLHILLSLYV